MIYDAFANVHDKVENSVTFENLLINEILKLSKDLNCKCFFYHLNVFISLMEKHHVQKMTFDSLKPQI